MTVTEFTLNKDIKSFPKVHPLETEMNTFREGISRMVMLDRYAFKDTTLKTLKIGDFVLLTYEPDPYFPKRGYGHVVGIDGDQVVVKLDNSFKDGETVTVYKTELDKPLEITYEQIARRVARGLFEHEDESIRDAWTERAYQQLANDKIVPAGRVLMGAGTDKAVTYFNCYVLPFIHDSREGIADHRKKTMEIMSRGGGVGSNGSTLRPRNATCHNVDGKSSGPVSWLQDLSTLTNIVQQGGSRRGAQMIMMADWHPDIVEFIISKMQKPAILRHLLTKVTSPLIVDEINRKLKFVPLTQTDRYTYEYVVETLKGSVLSSEQEVALKNAEQLLKDGGHYEVHNPDYLTGANISVTISKEFMKAIEEDGVIRLRYPDIDNYDAEERKAYDEQWGEIGDVREWEEMGHATKLYHVVPAKELWNLINTCATYAAEPGVFFIDNAQDMTNATAYDQKVVATNPCGEQALAPYSVCNLAAINLAKMTKGKQVDWAALEEAVKVCIRMQDNVISATPYFLEENTKQALGERRIGMGVMGLADLLIYCELEYGSPEGNKLVDEVFEFMKIVAYQQSIDLAKEKGSFPFLETLANGEPNVNGREKFINTGFMKTMPEHIRRGVLEHGIRNSHLLTVAPTGSTGTMVGVATGLEPYFSFVYYRSGRLGKFIPVVADIAVKWLEDNGYTVTEYNVEEMIGKLPKWFKGSMELSPEAHVEVQCTIQKHVDSSISKTVNAPRGYTVEQVEKVYEMLYAGGAKGGTVYVDGSRDTQVLTLTTEENDMTETVEEVTNSEAPQAAVDEKKVGNDVGDTCPVCHIGTLVEAGGCVTCNNCNVQTKCGL